MNCPGHFLLFGSEKRSYKELPLRFHEQTPLHRNEASGTLVGPDARPPVLAGRRALLPDASSRSPREVEALIKLDPAASTRTSASSYAAKLSTRPEKFLGESRLWDRRRGGAQAARSRARSRLTRSTPATAPSTGRRSTSTSRMRSDASGSAARFSSITSARAVRPEIHRRRQHRAPPGRDSPRHLRQLRALHRDPGRALRRRVPAVARAGAGHRPADRRSAPRLRQGGRRRALEGRASRPRSTTGRKRSITRFARPNSRKSPTCWLLGTRKLADRAVAVRSQKKGDLGARPLDQFVTDALAEVRAKALS